MKNLNLGKKSVQKNGLISKIFWVSTDDNDLIENEILFSQIYMEKAATFLNEILAEFIKHFLCYDFSDNHIINLIEQLPEQYSLNIKQKYYYIKIKKTNLLYQKNQNPFFIETKIKLKDDQINSSSNNYFYYNSGKKFKKIKNDKV